MSSKTLLAVSCAALLGVAAIAADEGKVPSCCAKVKQGTTAAAEKLRCSLTGKVVDRCCCVHREGKLHCTLADKDVAKCCCSKGEDKVSEAK
jgi:hypothetical protein